MTDPAGAAHLLIVDDDDRIRELLKKFLIRQGFLVTSARDAAQALAMRTERQNPRYLPGLAFPLFLTVADGDFAALLPGADLVIVADDNPRSEDPATIRAAVRQGCPEAEDVGDRAEAILRGVDALGPGDALLIMGKGHETGQEIAGQIFPFDDAEQASVTVAALDGLL